MFVPPAFAEEQAVLRGWMRRAPFAQLVTHGPEGLRATATPLIFATDAPDEPMMLGHMAARNGQAAGLEGPALALFHGPDAYVSPRWFRERKDLPTWNYVAIQLRGRLEPVDDLPGRLAVLRRTAEVMEAGRPEPWSMAEADPANVERLLPHIRAFRFYIERIEGALRLNQNRPESERQNLMAGLRQSHDAGAAAIVRLMEGAASRV